MKRCPLRTDAIRKKSAVLMGQMEQDNRFVAPFVVD